MLNALRHHCSLHTDTQRCVSPGGECAQRLAASLFPSQERNYHREELTERAQRLAASLFPSLQPNLYQSSGVSSAQRLAASLFPSQHTVTTISPTGCVLNALRHHCSFTAIQPRPQLSTKGCSTPCGITVLHEPGRSRKRRGQAVLNALRHHCSSLSSPRAINIENQVLNALRHHCSLHGKRRTKAKADHMCSTPCGITVPFTGTKSRPEMKAKCAQRLAASLFLHQYWMGTKL